MPSIMLSLNIKVTFVCNLTEYLDISGQAHIQGTQMCTFIMENIQKISLEVPEIMPDPKSREQREKYTMDELDIRFRSESNFLRLLPKVLQ